jgi:hypothetical protein
MIFHSSFRVLGIHGAPSGGGIRRLCGPRVQRGWFWGPHRWGRACQGTLGPCRKGACAACAMQAISREAVVGGGNQYLCSGGWSRGLATKARFSWPQATPVWRGVSLPAWQPTLSRMRLASHVGRTALDACTSSALRLMRLLGCTCSCGCAPRCRGGGDAGREAVLLHRRHNGTAAL